VDCIICELKIHNRQRTENLYYTITCTRLSQAKTTTLLREQMVWHDDDDGDEGARSFILVLYFESVQPS
jgi:hypothetical protein